MMDPARFLTHSLRQMPEHGNITGILQAAMQAVDPRLAVQRAMQLEGDMLIVSGRSYDLRQFDRVILVGFGKASAALASGACSILGRRVTSGAVIGKHIDRGEVKGLPEQVLLLQGDHPVPGENSVSATRQLLSILTGLTEKDLVLCLISGGGSALFTSPYEGVTLADLQELTRLLLASGAEIGEINALRKHLDRVKGGGLAKLAAPARLVTLIVSDVVGSPLDVIASGPTVPDSSTFADALGIVEKYGLREKAPTGLLDVLHAGAAGKLPETLKAGDPVLEWVHNTIIADNYGAAQAGVEYARSQGWNALLLTTYLRGEAHQAGMMLASILRQAALHGEPSARPLCMIAGGETTVTLRGDGLGGRNQELALGAVEELSGLERVALVALATDGDDGPSGAAGAVVTGETLKRGLDQGIQPAAYLRANDSYHYFEALGDLLVTGPSGTNVNDLTFLFAF